MKSQIHKSEEEWKKKLTPQQYHVLREKGTEHAFAGKYHDLHDNGMYMCAACGQPLFSSDNKFDSGTGWPSFDQPATGEAVVQANDRSRGIQRTEVLCSRCSSHLGHVFDDGLSQTTGKRFCINSCALHFKKTE